MDLSSSDWPDADAAEREIRRIAQKIIDGSLSAEAGAREIAADSLRVGDPVYPRWPELADEFTHGTRARAEVEADVRAAAEDLLRDA